MLPPKRTVGRPVLTAGLLIYAVGQLSAQPTAPKFEVASVRRAAPPQVGTGVHDTARGGPGTADPSQVAYTNLRLKDLLLTAYGVKGYQIAGPEWLETERYDVIAKIPPGAPKEQFPLMLQDLLVERFKISLHHETKDLPLYELGVAKSGPKLKSWRDPPNEQPIPQQAAWRSSFDGKGWVSRCAARTFRRHDGQRTSSHRGEQASYFAAGRDVGKSAGSPRTGQNGTCGPL